MPSLAREVREVRRGLFSNARLIINPTDGFDEHPVAGAERGCRPARSKAQMTQSMSD